MKRPAWLGGSRPLQWSVVVAAPGGAAGEQWGDTWFARDLVAALRRRGQLAKVVSRGGANSPARDDDDVVLVLRGLRAVSPRPGKGIWLLWVISHPELVEADEAARFDAVFAASEHWSRSAELGARPLLQATNPERFSPRAAEADSGDDILFVGSTRGEFRPVVRDALACGAEVAVYGVGWEQYLEPGQIRGEFVANDGLPAAYASAGVVLNDHWSDMAAEGFLSNRLFDAAATGARIVSDEAVGLRDVFGTDIRTYGHQSELCDLLSGDRGDIFPGRAARLALAARIAVEHSFDQRAGELIAEAQRLLAR